MSGRILLVEDDPLSLKLMRDFLQAHGYETFEVTDGRDVLAQATEIRPSLVVMDIGLPSMDGVQAARLLKRHTDTPVIAVTAYAMPDDERRMRDAGCEAYLTKPLHFAQFLSVVQQFDLPFQTGAGSPSGSEK